MRVTLKRSNKQYSWNNLFNLKLIHGSEKKDHGHLPLYTFKAALLIKTLDIKQISERIYKTNVLIVKKELWILWPRRTVHFARRGQDAFAIKYLDIYSK